MKVLVQRTTQAHVQVNQRIVGQIQHGMVLLVGIEKHDDEAILTRMARKICQYRLFSDSEGKMNLNLQQVGGGLLVISQFTLAADTQKGLRPSFSSAAPPILAEQLFNRFVQALRDLHSPVEQGIFAADMQVSLTNDGPVTFILEM